VKELIRREMFDKQYLLIEVEDSDKEGYVFAMYLNNSIDGFVSPKERTENGIEYLLYNITYLKTFEDQYRNRLIELDDLLKLIQGICRQKDKLSKYMLPGSGLLISEKYIFTDMNNGESRFVYIPLQDKPLQDTLLDYLIKKIDHEDDQMTEAVYEAFASRDIPGWEEALRSKLLLIKNERKIKNEERESTIYIEENPHGIDTIPDKFEPPDPQKRKKGICLVFLYTIIVIVFMYELFSKYLLNALEIGTLVLVTLICTLAILCIIIHYIEPSYIKGLSVKLNFIKKRDSNKEKDNNALDKRWFTGDDSDEETQIKPSKTRVRVFELDGQIAIETLDNECTELNNSIQLVPGQTLLFHPKDEILIDN